MLSDKSAQVLLQKYSTATFPGHLHEPIAAVNRSSATIDAIKAYILNHDLKPGDALPTEATLCETLQVSRSSVREAGRLAAEMLLTVINQPDLAPQHKLLEAELILGQSTGPAPQEGRS